MRKLNVKIKHCKVLKKRIKRKERKRAISELKKNGFSSNKRSKKFYSGTFFSKKNNIEYIFRSSYELAYFYILEDDNNVISYIVEPFKISYINPNDKKKHNYIPDLVVLYRDKTIKILEVKPKALLSNNVVKSKAAAARAFIKKNKIKATYQFITERDIFKTDKSYNKLKKILATGGNR